MPRAQSAPTRHPAALAAVGVTLALSTLLAGAEPGPTAGPTFEPGQKLAAAEPEFQLNSYTSDSQASPSVDRYDDGFVVVWRSSGSFQGDTDSSSILGRRLDEDGHPVSSEFQINSYTTGGQSQPQVAAWSDGRFVVTWRHSPYVSARIFDASGSPVADDFVVATNTSYLNQPDVDVRDDSLLVVWTDEGSDGDGRSIAGRLFASDGTELGGEIQINSYTTGAQASPSVSRNSAQDFLVVWASEGSLGDDSSSSSIQMRTVGGDGVPVGADLQVNSYTTGGAGGPVLDFSDAGGFVVAWTAGSSPGDDGDGAVLARRFGSGGDPIGGDFQVNTYTTGFQYASNARNLPDGGFLVTWSGVAPGSADTEGAAAVAHRFDSSGASGGEFVVNTLTAYYQSNPVLARNSLGDLLVVWDSSVSSGDDSSTSIQARYFAAEADVAVTVDNGVDTVTPGASVVYTVEVTNAGPDLGTGVELIDTLSSDLNCDWTSVASGGASGNTASGSGDLAETLRLPPGAAVTYTLACDIAFDATGGLLHTADVVVDQVDPAPSNDSAFDLDVLERSTDLGLTLAASGLQVGPGDEVELTATVTQSGPSASSGAMVFGGLPPDLTFVSSADCALTAGFVACEIPPLDPGEMASVTYRVAVDGGVLPGMDIEIEAVLLADDDDPNASNDLDGVTLAAVEPFVFADGFESGDSSMWSATVP